MVLQHSSFVNIWGNAKSTTIIEVRPSWNNKSYLGSVDIDGRFEVKIETPAASLKEYEIKINNFTIVNVTIGEVWFCSGQSNMVMPLNGFPHKNQSVNGAKELANEALTHPFVRLVKVDESLSLTPKELHFGTWKLPTSEDVFNWSVVALSFGLRLEHFLQVPIGLIVCAYSNSSIEAWLPNETLDNFPERVINVISTLGPRTGGALYYGMFYGCTSFQPIKGFIWYQGEGNVLNDKSYTSRMIDFIKMVRSTWQNIMLPFYYVEIAPYGYNYTDRAAFLREAQFKVQKEMKNTFMVSTNDLVNTSEYVSIHPPEKITVGNRLADVALSQTYGLDLPVFYPTFDYIKTYKNKIEVFFKNTRGGLSPKENLIGFEIANANKEFHIAEAKVNSWNQSIIVSSEEVPNPIAVRYCFRNLLVGNVKNSDKLPLIPFRSDEWDD